MHAVLMGCFLDRFKDERAALSSDEIVRNLNMISMLLLSNPGDVSADFRKSFRKALTDIADRLSEGRDIRTISAAIDVSSAFLLTNGTDVISQCPQLHATMHPLVLHCLHHSKDARTRATVVTYLRAQLQLDASMEDEQVRDLVNWAEQELVLHPSKW